MEIKNENKVLNEKNLLFTDTDSLWGFTTDRFTECLCGHPDDGECSCCYCAECGDINLSHDGVDVNTQAYENDCCDRCFAADAAAAAAAAAGAPTFSLSTVKYVLSRVLQVRRWESKQVCCVGSGAKVREALFRLLRSLECWYKFVRVE